MRRREFITGVGTAVAWPHAARAQPAERTRRIGLLVSSASDDPVTQVRVAVFMQGLQEAGWVIGRNVQIDTRYGAGDDERLRAMAGELLGLSPDLILALGGPSLRALRATNRATPVVFVGVIDPVGRGFVASLSRPGGNYTGFSSWEYGTAGKWLQLLKQIAPHVTRVAVTLSPAQSGGGGQLGAVQAVASLLNAEVTPIDDSEPGAFERGIEAFARGPNDGLVVTGSTRASLQRNRIIAVAAQRKLPAVYPDRSYATDGGLLSYGPDLLPGCRLAASYADRILKGEKPADLPVQAPTRYETVINLKTAKALGLEIPQTLLATADEVIQ
jgi:putative tryptophan/tyrosine transport system substrate-binding protein